MFIFNPRENTTAITILPIISESTIRLRTHPPPLFHSISSPEFLTDQTHHYINPNIPVIDEEVWTSSVNLTMDYPRSPTNEIPLSDLKFRRCSVIQNEQYLQPPEYKSTRKNSYCHDYLEYPNEIVDQEQCPIVIPIYDSTSSQLVAPKRSFSDPNMLETETQPKVMIKVEPYDEPFNYLPKMHPAPSRSSSHPGMDYLIPIERSRSSSVSSEYYDDDEIRTEILDIERRISLPDHEILKEQRKNLIESSTKPPKSPTPSPKPIRKTFSQPVYQYQCYQYLMSHNHQTSVTFTPDSPSSSTSNQDQLNDTSSCKKNTSSCINNVVPNTSDVTNTETGATTSGTTAINVRRHRHSIAGQMSYFKMLGFGFGGPMALKKIGAGSTNSLFSTAVISGSSSAPNLRDMIPTASASSE